jgi:hypothetical protein
VPGHSRHDELRGGQQTEQAVYANNTVTTWSCQPERRWIDHIQTVFGASPQHSGGTCTFTWDGENRMLTAGSVGFTYGPDGSRLKKTSGSTTTLYLGADVEKTGSTWTKYLIPDAVKVGSTVSYLHRDQSQSIRMRTTGAGIELEEAGYVEAPALTIEKGSIV